MRIGIIDADLVGRKRHRFPNLACMKISGYYKSQHCEVRLLLSYDDIKSYDTVFISKVFTDTDVPDGILEKTNVRYGGTGFFYDKAPKLPNCIEHHMPDYNLYSSWVESQIKAGKKASEFTFYTDWSIGFLTRGCFRHCAFCVNKDYDRVSIHSPLSEFLDKSRKKICLLDDNFFGCPDWRELLEGLNNSGIPFQFRQGLDERLLTDEKCRALFSSRYTGAFIFAFDNMADSKLITEKLELIRKHTDVIPRFYCLTGFDRNSLWNEDFWKQDIFDLFARIEILMKYRCLPYIMRYCRYTESPYRGLYISVARWCNQPFFFKKITLREFAQTNGENSACCRYIKDFEDRFPEVSRYYDMRFGA